MLKILYKVEKILPKLLENDDNWNSIYVNYHHPFVERLWMQYGTYRIYLHRIYPCKKRDALFHPHPWPSAMRIYDGKYEMAIGFGTGDKTPPISAVLLMTAGSEYEMTDPNCWHYVRPIGKPTMSLMVTGKPWNRLSPKSKKQLKPLPDSQKKEIIEFFRKLRI